MEKYIIIYADSIDGLIVKVNYYIEDGYIPIGGFIFKSNDQYYQTMVRTTVKG